MFASIVRCLSVFAVVCLALQHGTVVAALVDERDLQAREIPSAPHFVVYADSYQPGVIGPPPVSDLKVRFAVLFNSFRLLMNFILCRATTPSEPFLHALHYIWTCRLIS